MKRVKLKRRAFVVLVAALVLSANTLSAQGVFKRGSSESRDFSGGLLRGGSSSTTSIFTHQSFGNNWTGDFTHQSFGSNGDGNFTHQPFGNETPTGTGTLILLAAGAGYATLKRKKHHSNHQNKSNQKGK